MKIRYNSVLISAVLLSLCLVTTIPTSLRNVSTWNQLYLEWPHLKIQNYFATFGFAFLGIAMIGLIVLWTGYRKRERLAWLIMLIILLCFEFPSSVLPVILHIRAGHLPWSSLLYYSGAFPTPEWWRCYCLSISHPAFTYSIGIECAAVLVSTGVFKFLVMLIALLLPVKAFFWRSVAN
jgi:hypothetical protein